MTKRKTTRRALLLSLLSFLLCCAMLVGTTFAWFTDSVTSGRNTIASGNLDVILEYWDGNDFAEVQPTTMLFNNEVLWEPGHTEVAYLRVGNAGSLALKYRLDVNVYEEVGGINVEGEPFLLSDHLVFKVVPIDKTTVGSYDRDSAKFAAGADMGLEATQNGDIYKGETRELEPKDALAVNHYEDYVALIVYMPKSVGNEANYKTGTTPPFIDMGVELVATQLTYENDSFGNDYDENAALPVVSNKVPVDLIVPRAGLFKTKNMTIEVPADTMGDLGAVADELELHHAEPVYKEESVYFAYAEFYDEDGNVVDLEAIGNDKPITVILDVSQKFEEGDLVKILHDGVKMAEAVVDAEGCITYEVLHLCEIEVAFNPTVTITRNGVKQGFATIQAAMDAAVDGDTLVMRESYNTADAPLTETITVTRKISLNPNGMYLVSSAPATFTVVEGGDLTVLEGSFTIKNTASNGACVFVDGGAFEMAGGSFDGYAAVRTARGKSSEVTLSAGWSNRVTVGFELQGNDTLNVTNGTLYSSKQSVLATGDTTTINMTGGTLSGKSPYTYNASVDCKGATTINMTGGKIEATSGESIAITVYNNSEINISGNAVVAGTFSGVSTGGGMRPQGDNNVINISGNAKVSASGAGNSFGIGYAVYANSTNTNVTVSGNAQITGTSYGVYAGQSGSSITVEDAAVIKATTGKYSGYGVGCEKITITGGTIQAKEYAVISDFANSIVTIDNSTTQTPIIIDGGIYDVYVHNTTNYNVGGDPEFDTFGTRG